MSIHQQCQPATSVRGGSARLSLGQQVEYILQHMPCPLVEFNSSPPRRGRVVTRLRHHHIECMSYLPGSFAFCRTYGVQPCGLTHRTCR